jgi:catechol 2,3-dioxygenase-like lactoylglutathione lyase family enzyme
MTVQLDHAIVPSHNRVESARFLAGLLDVPWAESQGNFAPVFVNDALTLDFADRDQFERHHYCFRVSDERFDAILGRIQSRQILYRSSPRGANDLQINTRLGGKNLYWEDADGHLWEILTISYARPEPAVR